MRSSLTRSRSGSVVSILTENQIPIFNDGYHASGNQNAISMFLLANSIPLAKSACKVPAQVSDHLFQVASSILQHSPIEWTPESSGKIKTIRSLALHHTYLHPQTSCSSPLQRERMF